METDTHRSSYFPPLPFSGSLQIVDGLREWWARHQPECCSTSPLLRPRVLRRIPQVFSIQCVCSRTVTTCAEDARPLLVVTLVLQMAADPMATATRLTTVVFHEILLGMFLVPGEAGRGARIKHFQRNADGSLREAERAKSLKEGMQLIRVDDINIQHSDFIRVSLYLAKVTEQAGARQMRRESRLQRRYTASPCFLVCSANENDVNRSWIWYRNVGDP